MARTVKHAKLDTRTARAKLKIGRQAHWVVIDTRVHFGWRKREGDKTGQWLLRRSLGNNKYPVFTIGRADDDGDSTLSLSYEQAMITARKMADAPVQTTGRLTVRGAYARYLESKQGAGVDVRDLKSRVNTHIIPVLGDRIIADLTAEQLRRWRDAMAASPAQFRPRSGKAQYRPEPVGDEAIRKRRASANRVLTFLKAILNHAYDDGLVSNRDAWGRRLKPFPDVERARLRHLAVEDATRLINAADPEFRPLLRGALETGARYGELGRLQVFDFDPDAGTLAIRTAKKFEPRQVHLTEDGAKFFRRLTVGRPDDALIFTRRDGQAWKPSAQIRPMKEACVNGRVLPIGFHGLRHTWASLSVRKGMPLMVVARNLGHVDTRMVEKFYGHLARSFVTDAIRDSAPRYDVEDEPKVVIPLR
jgi:integrase